MAEITAQLVKDLRERTGAGMNGVQERSEGSWRATSARPRSCCASAVSPRPERKAAAPRSKGLIGTYIHHGGQLGVMVECDL